MSDLNLKKNVMISFVGNSDPWPFRGTPEQKTIECPEGENKGAVLGLCEELDGVNKIDILYMFPSCREKNPAHNDNTEWRAEWAAEILSKSRPDMQCRILPLDIDDATNFEQISKALDHNISLMLDELKTKGLPDDFQFHINCTSATQQMTAVAYVFANTGRIPDIIKWQCKNPKFLKPGEKRISEVNTTFLEESACRGMIKEGLKHFEFSSVRDNFIKLSKIAGNRDQKSRKDLYDFMIKVFGAYNALDMLRYKTAYATMHDAELHPGYKLLDNEYKSLFDRQFKLLASLKDCGEKETLENLSDLYYNMLRCFNRGAYADVLSRFWRIGEGSVYYVLANRWGINPRKLRKSKNNSNLQKILQDKRLFALRNSQFIGFDNGRTALLHIFQDPAACEKDFAEFFEKDVKEVTEQRNGTIVAHGMSEVSKDYAEKCIDYARRILCTLIPSMEKKISKYPFKEEDIKIWAAVL